MNFNWKVMFKFEILKLNKGAIITYVLVFGTIFLLLLAGLLGFILQQIKLSNQKVAWHESFNIAEAGMNYYRWCLNNEVAQNCQLEKEYLNIQGEAIGKFQIQLDQDIQCNQTISTNIISLGFTYKFPQIKRKISVLYARESVAKYNYILNSNVWVGSDHIIRGPFHSKGGVRFDGQNLSIVSSDLNTWKCTGSFNCGSNGVGYGQGLCPPECQIINHECVCPGVFSTTANSNRDLFFYPNPIGDFAAITADLNQMKKLTKDQNQGLYFGPSGANGYRISIQENNLKVWKVLETTLLSDICTVVNDKVICDGDSCQPECPQCVSNKCRLREPVIKTESTNPIYDGPIPQNCGVIFFEDNLWIGKIDQPLLIKGKISIASANLINPNQPTNVWLQGNIDYTNYDGSDSLLVISQNNNLVGLYSPNYMTLRGIFVAQNGFFGRNHYPCSKYSPYCQREELKIFGSIVSKGRVGTQWVNLGGHIESGYKKRETYLDPNLVYNPPLFTPFLSSQFKIVKWEEL